MGRIAFRRRPCCRSRGGGGLVCGIRGCRNLSMWTRARWNAKVVSPAALLPGLPRVDHRLLQVVSPRQLSIQQVNMSSTLRVLLRTYSPQALYFFT